MLMTDKPEYDPDEIGRQIGHDLFRYGRPLEALQHSTAIDEGFTEALHRGLPRLQPDRYTRKWLQLRLSAYRRERVVDATVTPAYLTQIDVAMCPVTRVVLTHGERLPSDWSIDRLNNDGAYAPSNLAVISTGANHAKGDLTFDEVLARSSRVHPTEGLAPAEWLRMASVMHGPCFATQPRVAPLIPLVAPLPARTARTGAQLIQFAFTERARTLSGMNLLIRTFKTVNRNPHASSHLQHFAEALHRGLLQVDVAWDVWLRPDVMNGLRAWRTSLSLSDWAVAGEIAMRLTAASRVGRDRVQSWHLPTAGYRQ